MAGQDLNAFKEVAANALEEVGPQAMLTCGIGDAYASGVSEFSNQDDVSVLIEKDSEVRTALPNVFVTNASKWMNNKALHHEVFGPAALIIEADNVDELIQVANSLQGQLTATLQMADQDIDIARKLVPILERKAGRLLVNGFPTGVEVCDSMVHGGPYPASTNFGATSVGTMAIRRFLRPVCYQDFPEALLPKVR